MGVKTMKCNLKCPYSKPNGRDTNGNQSIICESRKWFMTDADECIEKFDEKTISNLKRIFGDGAMPKEKFRVFTELPTNEKMIVNMITDDNLTLEDACNLLNNQDQQIKELKEDLNGCNKTAKNAIDFIRAKNEICKDVLQKHYDYAYNERQKNLDDAIFAATYDALRYTVSDIADELGIKIKK